MRGGGRGQKAGWVYMRVCRMEGKRVLGGRLRGKGDGWPEPQQQTHFRIHFLSHAEVEICSFE